jgi:hypothetical protein
MVSQLHESLLLPFRNQPTLAADLIRGVLQVELPQFTDADRSKLHFDLIMSSSSEAARSALRNMDTQTYEYQSDFARQYVAEGVAQGEASGRAALIARLLAVRFGPLTDEARERVFRSPVAELDAIGERLLTARTMSEALAVA